MTPVVSIIMGSTSDLPVMEKAAKFLDEMEIPFEMHALSAHRTPEEVEKFAKGAKDRGIRVIIAAAGMAAHLCRDWSSDVCSSDLPVWCHCFHDDCSRHRCTYQFDARRYGCLVGYRTDASGNSGCYRRDQRSLECRYPGRTDAGCRR